MMRWRQSSWTSSTRISRNSRIRWTRGSGKPRPAVRRFNKARPHKPKPRTPERPVLDRAEQGPDQMTEEYRPRLFHSDAEISHLGEGLVARTLPRAEWTH